MANRPYRYYEQKIAKSSDYLHYWYVNSDLQHEAAALFNKTKNQIGVLQLARYKQIQQNVFSGQNKAMQQTIDDLGQIFDASVYQDNLNAVLEQQGADTIEDLPTYHLDNIETAVANLRSMTPDTVLNRLEEFSQSVSTLLSSTISPLNNQHTVDSMGEALFREYAIKSNIMSSKTKIMTNEQKSRTANKILRDILSKRNRKLFRVNTSDTREFGSITETQKRFALLVQALDNFDGGIATGNVATSKGIKRQDTAQFFSTLAQRTAAATNWMKKRTLNLVAETTGLEGTSEFIKTKLNADKTLVKNIRGKSMDTTVTVTGNETYERILSETQNTLKVNSAARANTSIRISKNEASAELGFNVAKSAPASADGLNPAGKSFIIQNSESLATILFRDMQLSSSAYQALLQLLVGHSIDDNEDSLNTMWEGIKQNILYESLISALVGNTDGLNSFFYVINDTIIPMENLILEIFTNPQEAITLSMNNISTTGSLSRSSYLNLNIWQTPGVAKPEPAIERSDRLWSSASAMLQNTRVNILLNMADMKLLNNLV